MEKKRVLIVNKFYYARGGDCIVAMNLERLLKESDHEVAVMAMQHEENVDSGWNSYYAQRVSFEGSLGEKLRAAERLMGWGDIKPAFNRILDDFKPDVVHLHNIHSYLSPVVAQLAKRRGCRVVWTLHDHKLVCPAYLCLSGGKPCERCIGRSKLGVVAGRCLKGSLVASVMAWIEALRWNCDVLNEAADALVCPSQALADKMIRDGFDKEKIHVVCNHIDPVKQRFFNSIKAEREDYYAYVGRISSEKGVATLLRVASQLPYTLKIAGDGPLLQELRQRYCDVRNIEFCGRLDAKGVAELLCKAQFTVMPSECYDNNPLGVIESLCAGTPVVGARIGGIPELLNDVNGITFTSGNATEMSESIAEAFSTQWNHEEIKAQASIRFAEQEHLRLIEQIYEGNAQ